MDPFQLRSWSEGWLKLKSSLERPSDKWQKTHIIAKSEYFREASIRKKQKKDWSFASQGGGGGGGGGATLQTKQFRFCPLQLSL